MGLEWQSENWATLMDAEHRMHKTPGLLRVMQSILFLQQDIVRECMVMLAQHGHKFIPPPLQKVLSCMFEGHNQTVIIEKAFQKLKDISREQKDSRMSRCRRWHYTIESKLLSEFGRKELVVEGQPIQGDGSIPKHVPPNAFEAQGIECSIGDDTLKTLLKDKSPSWLSLGPPAMQVQAGAWQLVMQLRREGSWDRVSQAYGSLLLNEDRPCPCLARVCLFLGLAASESASRRESDTD